MHLGQTPGDFVSIPLYMVLVRVCSDSNPPKSDKMTAITAALQPL